MMNRKTAQVTRPSNAIYWQRKSRIHVRLSEAYGRRDFPWDAFIGFMTFMAAFFWAAWVAGQ